MEELDLLGTGEQPITMAEAAKLLPKREGKTFPIKNILRWVRTGYRGVFLEATKVGNIFVTSAEALKRFCDKCRAEDKGRFVIPQAAVDAVNAKPDAKAKKPAKSRAQRELEAAGWGGGRRAKAS